MTLPATPVNLTSSPWNFVVRRWWSVACIRTRRCRLKVRRRHSEPNMSVIFSHGTHHRSGIYSKTGGNWSKKEETKHERNFASCEFCRNLKIRKILCLVSFANVSRFYEKRAFRFDYKFFKSFMFSFTKMLTENRQIFFKQNMTFFCRNVLPWEILQQILPKWFSSNEKCNFARACFWPILCRIGKLANKRLMTNPFLLLLIFFNVNQLCDSNCLWFVFKLSLSCF